MIVVDISCPDCDAVDEVRKISLGTYVCGACGLEFTATDYREETGTH